MDRVYTTKFGRIRRGWPRPDGRRFIGFAPNGHERWASPQAWENHIADTRTANLKRTQIIKSNPDLQQKNRKAGLAYRKLHPEFWLLYSARHRAKARGLPCTITMSDIHIPVRCPVLGIPLISRMGTGLPAQCWFDSPTLDRIIPKLGYIPGNVIVVSFLANAIKRDATPDQILAVGEFYKKLEQDAVNGIQLA